MAPAPNFGVFLDLAHPFLTEVDFSLKKVIPDLRFRPRDHVWQPLPKLEKRMTDAFTRNTKTRAHFLRLLANEL